MNFFNGRAFFTLIRDEEQSGQLDFGRTQPQAPPFRYEKWRRRPSELWIDLAEVRTADSESIVQCEVGPQLGSPWGNSIIRFLTFLGVPLALHSQICRGLVCRSWRKIHNESEMSTRSKQFRSTMNLSKREEIFALSRMSSVSRLLEKKRVLV
jgi:hypothetical protein